MQTAKRTLLIFAGPLASVKSANQMSNVKLKYVPGRKFRNVVEYNLINAVMLAA